MKILILRGKYGDHFYKADNPEELHESALKVLRNNKHWYYEPEKPTELEFTKETINSLPESLQDKAESDLLRFERDLKDYNKEKVWYNDMIKADKENNGKAAYRLISLRQDYEYEDFYFGTLE